MATIRVYVARPTVGARMAVRPTARRSLTVCMATKPETNLQEAIQKAEALAKEAAQKAAAARAEAAAAAAEVAAAWDKVEALSSGKKPEEGNDPLEAFCAGSPDADECRVYED